MAVEFPDLCEGLIPDLLEENLRKVVESVFGENAFKNPLESKLRGINDRLSEITGVLPSTAPISLKGALQNFKDSLDQFKDHTDRLAGVKDTGENFVRRLSVANIENLVKQQLGQIGDSFERMFGSFNRDIDRLLNDSVTQLDLLIGVFGQGGTLNEINNFVTQINAFSSQLTNAIANDVAQLLSAENLLARFNLANLITTNNCFFETLIKDGIGTDQLLANFQSAVDFKSVIDLNVDLRPSQTYSYLKKTFERTPEDENKLDREIITSDIIPQDLIQFVPGNNSIVEQSKKSPVTNVVREQPKLQSSIVINDLRNNLSNDWREKYKPIFDYLDGWARTSSIRQADINKFVSTDTRNVIQDKKVLNLNTYILQQQKKADSIIKQYPNVKLIPDAKYWEIQKNIAAARWIFFSSIVRPVMENVSSADLSKPLLVSTFIRQPYKETVSKRNLSVSIKVYETETKDVTTLDSIWRGFEQTFVYGQLGTRISSARLLKQSPSIFGVSTEDANMFLFLEMSFYPPSKNEAEATKDEKTAYYETLNKNPIASQSVPTYIMEFDGF